MTRMRSRLRTAAAALALALTLAAALAPAAFADVVTGGDSTGGTILFWLVVLTCVGIVIGTAVFYVDRRRRR